MHPGRLDKAIRLQSLLEEKQQLELEWPSKVLVSRAL
jgi:hypothetical protein